MSKETHDRGEVKRNIIKLQLDDTIKKYIENGAYPYAICKSFWTDVENMKKLNPQESSLVTSVVAIHFRNLRGIVCDRHAKFLLRSKAKNAK